MRNSSNKRDQSRALSPTFLINRFHNSVFFMFYFKNSFYDEENSLICCQYCAHHTLYGEWRIFKFHAMTLYTSNRYYLHFDGPLLLFHSQPLIEAINKAINFAQFYLPKKKKKTTITREKAKTKPAKQRIVLCCVAWCWLLKWIFYWVHILFLSHHAHHFHGQPRFHDHLFIYAFYWPLKNIAPKIYSIYTVKAKIASSRNA